MSKKLSLKEVLGRQGETRDADPGASVFPTIKLLLESGSIDHPVDVIRVLARGGVPLKKSHGILDRLALGERVPVAIATDNSEKLISDLQRLGVTARAFIEPHVDVKRVRESQRLSQQEFAALYALELDTLQNWEQGRNTPDRATMILLKIIERSPDAVLEALTEDAVPGKR